jgi:aspartate carbamoyltransferase regulatory subunit
MPQEELRVAKIRNGTVIDHIPAGKALQVLRILGIKGIEGHIAAILMNVPSGKLGKKDLVKIEDMTVGSNQAQLIALIAPDASLNIVSDYEVKKKHKPSPPDVVEGLVRCPNMMCISNKRDEPIVPKLSVESKDPVVLRCVFCRAILPADEISAHLVE